MTKKWNALNIVLLQRKGGKTSILIIDELIKRPYNINQLSKTLGISYNTVHYHLKMMNEYKLVEKESDEYGSMYHATAKLLNHIEYYKYIKTLI